MNAVTVPADKLPELQAKAAQRDDLLEAVTLMLLDVDGNEWEDSDISDNDWDVRIENGKTLARKAIAKAKVE
jgi:hypothetical protein